MLYDIVILLIFKEYSFSVQKLSSCFFVRFSYLQVCWDSRENNSVALVGRIVNNVWVVTILIKRIFASDEISRLVVFGDIWTDMRQCVFWSLSQNSLIVILKVWTSFYEGNLRLGYFAESSPRRISSKFGSSRVASFLLDDTYSFLPIPKVLIVFGDCVLYSNWRIRQQRILPHVAATHEAYWLVCVLRDRNCTKLSLVELFNCLLMWTLVPTKQRHSRVHIQIQMF